MTSGSAPVEFTIVRTPATAEPGLEVSVVNHHREMAFCGDRWSWLAAEEHPHPEMRIGILQHLTTAQILRSELGRRLGVSPSCSDFDGMTPDALAAAGINAQWLQIDDELILATHPTMEVRVVAVEESCCTETEKRRTKNHENDAITSIRVTTPEGSVAAISLWPAVRHARELTSR